MDTNQTHNGDQQRHELENRSRISRLRTVVWEPEGGTSSSRTTTNGIKDHHTVGMKDRG